MPLDLTGLPVELLLEIATYLPVSALISLKLAHRQLLRTIPVPAEYDLHKLAQCEKHAVRRAINEQKYRESGRRWCLICKTLQPLRSFLGDAAICDWHEARFMRVGIPRGLSCSTKKRLLEFGEALRQARWVRIKRNLCVHCHTVQAWDARGCYCSCPSCSYVEVECLVRLSRKADTPSRFERASGNKQLVAEEFHSSTSLEPYFGNTFWKLEQNSTMRRRSHVEQTLVPVLVLQ